MTHPSWGKHSQNLRYQSLGIIGLTKRIVIRTSTGFAWIWYADLHCQCLMEAFHGPVRLDHRLFRSFSFMDHQHHNLGRWRGGDCLGISVWCTFVGLLLSWSAFCHFASLCKVRTRCCCADFGLPRLPSFPARDRICRWNARLYRAAKKMMMRLYEHMYTAMHDFEEVPV